MKKIISIFAIVCSTIVVKAQTYRQLFDKLNVSFQTQPHSFFSQLEGSRVETNAKIMSSYLNMYEATQDIKYLNQFIIVSKRVMDRRDDFINSAPFMCDGSPLSLKLN
jgi:hypothetical protein